MIKEILNSHAATLQRQADIEWLRSLDQNNTHLMSDVELRRYLRRTNPIPLATRNAIFVRCKGVCEDCKQRPFAELHHRTYHFRNGYVFGIEKPDHLLALCRPCHLAKHFLEDGSFWMPEFRRLPELVKGWPTFRGATWDDWDDVIAGRMQYAELFN